MSRDRNATKAGLFIILSFIAIVAVVMAIRDGWKAKMLPHTVAFALTEDLSGLNAGDDVRIGGTKVGKVDRITFDPADSPTRILVEFSIPEKYVFRENPQIGVQSALTGPSNLNITNLGTGNPLPPTAQLTGVSDSLFSTFKRIGPQIEKIAGTINTVTLPALKTTLGSIDKTANGATATIADVRGVINDNKAPVKETIANVKVASEKLPPLLDKATTAATKVNAILDKADGAVVSAKAALKDAEKAVQNFREVSETVRTIVIENHAKVDAIIKSLKTTSETLKTTMTEVRHSPWRVFNKPLPEEIGNAALYDSARQFAEGAASLDEAAQALRDAVKNDPNLKPADLQALLDQLTKSFNQYRTAEDKLWKSVKE